MKKIVTITLLLISSLSFGEDLKIRVTATANETPALYLNGDGLIYAGSKIMERVEQNLGTAYNIDTFMNVPCGTSRQHTNHFCAEMDYVGNSIHMSISNVDDPKNKGTLKIEEAHFKNPIDVGNRVADFLYKSVSKEPSHFLEKLALVGRKGKEYTVRVANFDGTSMRAIFRSKSPVLSPTISPNGDWILYTSYERYMPTIVLQNLSTGKRYFPLKNLSGSHYDGEWHPRGTSFTFTSTVNGNANIYLYDINSARTTQLTTGNDYNSNSSWIDRSNVLYTKTSQHGVGVYQIDLERKRSTAIPPLQYKYSVAKTILNGDGYLALENNGASSELKSMNKYGLESRTVGSGKDIESPSSTRNSRIVAFSVERAGKRIIRIVNTYGEDLFEITARDTEFYEPNY